MKKHLKVSQRQEALAERHLCEAVAQLRTAEECRAFFRDLCTPAEIQAMADRWAVVESLRRGRSYREVNRLTGVSLTTIGRVARFLANGNGGYALAASRLGPARQGEPSGPAARRGNGAVRGNGTARSEGARHA
jgi:TrpR-related protein YerC/YecD